MSGLPLFIIEPDGTVTERYVERLPESRDLEREYFDGAWAEHVTVLWHGKRAHAFVDENGSLKNLPVNRKATAIYHNASRHRINLAQYSALHDSPDAHITSDAPPIVGRMLLWPHRAPGWE